MITACAASESSKDQNSKVKMDTAVVDGENKAISFAKQCVKICSQDARKMGVTSHKKLNKREDKKKMKERICHYQDVEEVEFNPFLTRCTIGAPSGYY